MRWTDQNPFASGRLDPAAGRPPAGKDQRMHGILLDYRKLDVTLEGSCRNDLPYCVFIHRSSPTGIFPFPNRSVDFLEACGR